MSQAPNRATLVAKELVLKHPREIDLHREFSNGPGGGKTLIDEEKTQQVLGWKIRNQSSNPILIAIASLKNYQYVDETALITALGVGAVLKTGTIATDVIVSSLNPGRVVSELLNYASNTPIRMLKWQLMSTNLTGVPETTNFNNEIKTVWVSPFARPVENELQLRNFQNAQANQPQYAKIDFLKERFPMLLSNENFIIIQVNANTELSITIDFGAQDSRAQQFYRRLKQADEILAPYRSHVTQPQGCSH